MDKLEKKQMETPHNFTFQSSAAAVVFGGYLSARPRGVQDCQEITRSRAQ